MGGAFRAVYSDASFILYVLSMLLNSEVLRSPIGSHRACASEKGSD